MRIPAPPRTRAPQRAARAFAVVAAGSLALPVAAQNLLANPAFDGGLTGWSNSGSAQADDGTRSFAAFPEDVGGVAGSGSAQLAVAATAPTGTQIGLTQCVPVAANQTYNYGARIKQPAGQAPSKVLALIHVMFYSDAGCATPLNLGEEQGFGFGVAYALSDTEWRAIPGTVPTTPGGVVSPVGAASAQYRVLLERTGSGGIATVRFDNPFFGMNLTPVQLQTYTVD